MKRHRLHRGLLTLLTTAGVLFLLGCATPLHAQTEDLASLQTKAEAGDPIAEYRLGQRYWNGAGVQRDRRLGLDWIRKSAEAGNAGGQNFLAGQLCCGIVGPIDKKQSAYWFEKAAEQGHIFAQSRLGHIYQTGDGVAQDIEKAVYWYRKAAAQGSESSKEALNALALQTNPASQSTAAAVPMAQLPIAGINGNTASTVAEPTRAPLVKALDSTVDLRTVSGADILSLLSLDRVPGVLTISKDQKKRLLAYFYYKDKFLNPDLNLCNRNGEPQACASIVGNLQPSSPSDSLLVIGARLLGCWGEARQQPSSNCFLLAKAFHELGNDFAAKAILQHAPGCHSVYHGDTYQDACFKQVHYNASMSALFTPQELLALAQGAYSRDQDRDAANYLAYYGHQVDMNAVARADNAKHEAFLADQEETAEKEARQDRAQAASEDRRNAIIGLLQSMPGGSDPNAIVNAGNQQAASIRAVGDANAAQQQLAAQQRAAARQAAAQQAQQNQPVASQNASSVAASSPASDSGENSSAHAVHYVAPLPATCIRQFWDAQVYNWLSFENNCGQAINLNFIFNHPVGWAMTGSMNLAPGAHDNTGRSSSDINQAGGFKFYACPAGTVPVDVNGNTFNTNVTDFRCKQQ